LPGWGRLQGVGARGAEDRRSLVLSPQCPGKEKGALAGLSVARPLCGEQAVEARSRACWR